MSIHKRETATKGTVYVVRWRDPRPRERSFDRQNDAERFERKVRHEIDAGTYRDPRLAKITFGRWYERWWQTIEGSDRAPNTIAQYENIGENHVVQYQKKDGKLVVDKNGRPQIDPRGLGARRIAELTRIDFEEWLSYLRAKGLGTSAMRTARTIAFMVMESALHARVIATNPAARLRVGSGATRAKQALTAKQVETLIGELPERYRALGLVLAYGGLRPGEALALRRRHLDDLGQVLVEEGVVETKGRLIERQTTKTHHTRIVPLPGSVAKCLAEHLETYVSEDAEARMFTTERSAPLRLSNFRDTFTDARDVAGLPRWVTPYTFRHTAASLLAQQGVPVTTAASLLGHDPAIYLRTYAHLYPGDLRAAADALETARSDDGSKVTELSPRIAGKPTDHAGISRGDTQSGDEPASITSL